MTSLIHWLEVDKSRLRKVIAIFTALVWLGATIASYVLLTYTYDTLAVYSLVTAQFAAVVGFYMGTRAETD
jgi:hypothetical protein